MNRLIGLALGAVFSASFAAAVRADDLAQGKAVFTGAGACVTCHGEQGKGDGPAAAALNPKPAHIGEGQFKYDTDKDGKAGTENDIFNMVTNGAAAYGGSPLMVARPDLPEADRKAVAKYVRSLSGATK